MIQELLSQLKSKQIIFKDVLAHIDAHYTHTPTAFRNGSLTNGIGENQGSARVFSFARIHNLSQEDTLLLFAEHYDDVLATPEGSNHQNIRQFMQHGWEGIIFEGEALAAK